MRTMATVTGAGWVLTCSAEMVDATASVAGDPASTYMHYAFEPDRYYILRDNRSGAELHLDESEVDLLRTHGPEAGVAMILRARS